MKGTELLEAAQWKLSWLGFEHQFFSISVSTVINTWVVIGIIILLCLITHHMLKHKFGVGRFMIIEFVGSFVELCEQAMGAYFSFNHFVFITTLFTFIFLCNIVIIFPWLEEPTKDLNTTLALGFIGFIYIQVYAIHEHGIKAYIKEYFSPFFLMFPLHLIGKLASVISVSFRLFGNIFGGAIISHIYLNAIEGSFLREFFGLLSGMNHFIILGFFGLFVGFLQAFVFMMLNLTYLSIALQGEGEEES